MTKYLEAEKRLAELLGWNECHGGWQSPHTNRFAALPQWCRDDAAAFRLMVEEGCYPAPRSHFETVVIEHVYAGRLWVEKESNHPDKASAVRYAIVMAVINKLEITN